MRKSEWFMFREVPHLREGKAVLVRLFVLQLKVIQCLALWRRLWEWLDHLYEAGWEEAVHSAHFAVVPVLVHLPAQDDDITLAEFEVARFLAIVVVQGLGARELGYSLQREGRGGLVRYVWNFKQYSKAYLKCAE